MSSPPESATNIIVRSASCGSTATTLQGRSALARGPVPSRGARAECLGRARPPLVSRLAASPVVTNTDPKRTMRMSRVAQPRHPVRPPRQCRRYPYHRRRREGGVVLARHRRGRTAIARPRNGSIARRGIGSSPTRRRSSTCWRAAAPRAVSPKSSGRCAITAEVPQGG